MAHHDPLNAQALDRLFLEARTYNGWLDREVDDELLHRLHDLLRMAPTAANGQPARFVFVRSPEAKKRLQPALAPGNVDKTMAAPVTVIVGADHEFYERLPELFPHTDARSWYAGNQPFIDDTARRNTTLQGAYLILAARALGLDCGPMSGFDNAAVDQEFFAGTAIRSDFLVNLGYGDPSSLFPRSPRPEFSSVCQLL